MSAVRYLRTGGRKQRLLQSPGRAIEVIGGSKLARPGGSVRRRIEFDSETWHALDRLAKDRMSTIQELAEEAFRDLLKKHRRPTTLKEMLQASARSHPANDTQPPRKRRSS